jgi:hypothetical protein
MIRRRHYRKSHKSHVQQLQNSVRNQAHRQSDRLIPSRISFDGPDDSVGLSLQGTEAFQRPATLHKQHSYLPTSKTSDPIPIEELKKFLHNFLFPFHNTSPLNNSVANPGGREV